MNKYRVIQGLIFTVIYCLFFFVYPYSEKDNIPIFFELAMWLGILIPSGAVIFLLWIWLDLKANESNNDNNI